MKEIKAKLDMREATDEEFEAHKKLCEALMDSAEKGGYSIDEFFDAIIDLFIYNLTLLDIKDRNKLLRHIEIIASEMNREVQE